MGFVVCGHEGQLFIDNFVVDGEDAACSNNDTSLTGITDLNRKRNRHSAGLRAVLSPLSVFEKNKVLLEKVSVLKIYLS